VGQKMTEHPLELVRRDPSTGSKKPRHPLGELDAERVAKHLVLFNPTGAALEALLAKARERIPGMTDNQIVQKVIKHNSDCLWAVARKRQWDPANPVGEGFIAMLPLTENGLKLLATNTLDTRDPDLRHVVPEGKRPAGIYIWATFAPGTLAAGVALFMQQMASPLYSGINLYTRPNTADGRRFNETLGLQKGAKIGPVLASHLYVFHRAPRGLPLYDSYRRNTGDRELSVTVARSFEDLSRVISMRSAVYMSEQECPYEEEFDGNDLSATHLLGYVGDEPAGCLRIRFFAASPRSSVLRSAKNTATRASPSNW
jgi:hypothetical protein